MASSGSDQEKSFCGRVFHELFLGVKQRGAGLDLLAGFDQLILFIHLFIRHLFIECLPCAREWGHAVGIGSEMQTIYSQGFSTLAGETQSNRQISSRACCSEAGGHRGLWGP